MYKSDLHKAVSRRLLLIICILLIQHVLWGNTSENQGVQSYSADKKVLMPEIDQLLGRWDINNEQAEQFVTKLNALTNYAISDSLFFNKLHSLAYHFSMLGYTSSARRTAEIGLAFYQKHRFVQHEVEVQQLLVDIYISERKLDSARWLLKQTERDWLMHAKGQENPYILHSKANLAEIDGRYLEASQQLIIALGLFEQRGNELDAAVVRLTLADLYTNMKMYAKALQYNKLAYEYFKSKSLDARMLVAGINIASVHKQTGEYQQSLEWNQQNILKAKAMDNQVSLAMIYMNMGNTLNRFGKYDAALAYLDSSLVISEALGLRFGIFLYHLNKADVLVKINKPKEAIRLLESVAETMREYASSEITIDYNLTMHRAYEQLGRFEDALRCYKISQSLQDSLDTDAAVRFMLEWEGLMEKERGAREIVQLNEAVARGRFQTWMVLVGSLAVILVLFFWIRMRYRVYKLKRQLIEADQLRLMAELASKNKELASKAIQSAAIGETLTEVSKKVSWLIPRVGRDGADKLSQILKDLEIRNTTTEWKDVDMKFAQVHEHFFKRLYEICPNLTPSEIKLCGLLRLNMTSKEIALLTNRSVATIDNSRTVIRKKLGLPPEDSLTKYLLSI